MYKKISEKVIPHVFFICEKGVHFLHPLLDGIGGLVVSILATGTRVRGFKPGRSCWIFQAPGKSSVCLPSEGK